MEPCAGHRVLVPSRAAAVELYGKAGLRDIAARLPADARAALVDTAIITDLWLPERFIIAWHEAVWNGPAHGDEAEFRRYVRTVVDLGFGRVRRCSSTSSPPPPSAPAPPSSGATSTPTASSPRARTSTT
jgi:hypothetical protein